MKSLNEVGVLTRQGLRVALIGGWVALGGCGGGGGGEAASTGSTNTVVVTMTDVFGEPAEGVGAFLYRPKGKGQRIGATSDAAGRVEFANVPPGAWSVHAGTGDIDAGDVAAHATVTVPNRGPVDVPLMLRPESYPFPIFAAAKVEAGGLAADGRSLEFSLRLLPIGVELTAMRDCAPEAGNDAAGVQPDCVRGPVGFDVAYEAVAEVGKEKGAPVGVATIPGGAPEAFAVAVLVDQGIDSAAKDPEDKRLFALKYFLTTLHADDRVVLAAFASDDVVSGRLSLLPQSPVAVFPVDSPQFAAADRRIFPTIDSLATLEGGASPLYASIDRMLDFTAANTPSGMRRAVVVLTEGRDTTCGSASQCRTAIQGLIDKSRATGVKIVTIGMPSSYDESDVIALRELAESSGGAALWLDANKLGSAFGELRNVLDGSAAMRETRFRIRSTSDGVFQSGRTVLGAVWAEYTYCALSCDPATYSVPFAVRLP